MKQKGESSMAAQNRQQIPPRPSPVKEAALNGLKAFGVISIIIFAVAFLTTRAPLHSATPVQDMVLASLSSVWWAWTHSIPFWVIMAVMFIFGWWIGGSGREAYDQAMQSQKRPQPTPAVYQPVSPKPTPSNASPAVKPEDRKRKEKPKL